MDFDLSKENIQPLRGGRNVSQLEVALQAQSDVELQQELLQQKGAFEEAIRTYSGDDPLDNWYNYISWVEQSYPKHGHEGNLVPLLEDCLAKFENDERYIHDRRFCKLWIKYIDLQQNPLELFQLLYSKGICKSCADLYRAWAYYHEATSDFKKADIVFKLGLGEMAQPYEELVYAHKNMYEAFGRHTLQGVDERRLMEQRQALTSLKSYKHNHRTVVSSVRVGNQVLNSTPGSLQQNQPRQQNTNNPVSLYEDSVGVAGPSIGGGASAVISVLDVAKKQEVQKENTLKPGTWKKSIITKKLPHNHVPSFTVHEDEDPQYAGGVRLPPNFCSTNQDDFTTWITDLYFPEPSDPRHVPMYPKHLVYAEQPNKEYSLEEIRARKWLAKKQQSQLENASVNMQETMMEEANIIIPIQPVNNPQPENNFHHFGLPKHPMLPPAYNTQDHHFNPDIQNSMFVQSYMPTNISGFHLANSTKNPDPTMYQPSDTTINNCAEQFNAAAAPGGPGVSFVFPQNFPQPDECSMRALANTSERFMTHNNSGDRFIPQNNTGDRFMAQNNSGDRFMPQNNSAERFMAQNSSGDRFMPQNNSGDRFMPQNNTGDRFMPQNNSAERFMAQNSSGDRFMPQINTERFLAQNNSGDRFMAQNNSGDRFMPQNNTGDRFMPQNNTGDRAMAQTNSGDRFMPQNNTGDRVMAQNNTGDRFMPQNNSGDRFMPQNNTGDRFMAQNNSERFMAQNNSGDRYMPQNNSEDRYMPQNNTGDRFLPQNNSMERGFPSVDNSRQQIYEQPHLDKSGMYQTPEPSISFHAPQQQQQQQQQWLPNNGVIMPKIWPNATTTSSDDNYTVNMREAIKDINEIFKDNTTPLELPKPEITKFQIHEDTKLQDLDNKPVSVGVKRSPFKIFADEEEEIRNAQNGGGGDANKLHFNIYEDDKQKSPPQKLRSNMRAPFAAQHVTGDSAPQFPRSDDFVRPADPMKKPFSLFEDENNVAGASGFTQPSFDDSCNTQAFNINLNQYKASTPFNYKKVASQQLTDNNVQNADNQMRQSKKVLFDEQQDAEEATVARSNQEDQPTQDKLSVIFEKTNESRFSSSSSSGGTTLKTTTFHRESLKVIPEASYNNEDSSIVKKQPSSGLDTETKTSTTTTTYDVLKIYLMKDDESSPSKLDLSHDLQPFKLKDKLAAGPSAMTNYVSPVKNLFREMSCDSNDSFSSSPTKGSKMEVDIQSLMQPHHDPQMMDQEQSQSNNEKFVLLKAPSDPFALKVTTEILSKIGFTKPKYAKQYFEMQSLPRLMVKKEIACFIDDRFIVEKVVGKGAFGSVYKAVDLSTDELVALKYQKPANKWEYYIAKEIQERITNPYMKIAFMDVTAYYVSPTASVLVSKFHKIGSLLDITNKVKQVTGKGLKELIAIYYASEIITIVNTLHQCKIIHADIKPDNFLVTKMPPEFGYPSLQLIDFGSSIDMSVFPEGTSFTSVVNTENFICTEMKDGRPWTYQTDIFCVAATIHVLLFDKYMQVKKTGTAWSIMQRIPRYLQTDLWKSFFFEMLNIESCDKLPNLNDFKLRFEEITSKQSEELQMEMKLMANSVLGR